MYMNFIDVIYVIYIIDRLFLSCSFFTYVMYKKSEVIYVNYEDEIRSLISIVDFIYLDFQSYLKVGILTPPMITFIYIYINLKCGVTTAPIAIVICRFSRPFIGFF